jgi:hypothetical protein
MGRARLVAWVLSGASGCVVGPLDLSGRACPCTDGWVCDVTTDTCRRGENATEPGATQSSGGETSITPDEETDGISTPAFEVVAFSSDWSTPNAIHWTWAVVGRVEDFHAWEVRVAASREALDGDDVQVFDGSINPELARFTLRNTGDEEPVTGTITDGLDASTEYFARLFVLDTAGGRTMSPNVAVRSTGPSPTNGVAILSDVDPIPPGLALPSCYVHADDAPAAGTTHHYQLRHFCTSEGVPTCTDPDEPGPECWENLRLQGMTVPVTGLAAGDFADAYLELYVAVEALADVVGHGWWSELALVAGGGIHAYKGLTIRADGQYRRYQIPLVQLGLTHRVLASVAEGLRVGSSWSNGSTIRVDEAWIRW